MRIRAVWMIPFVLTLFMFALPVPAPGQEIGATHELTELAEGVFAVRGRFQGANATIVINDGSVLVVDSHGSPASAAALLEEVGRLTDQPVRYVVNTHWHADHHVGNQAYYRAFPGEVEFISHRFTREDIPEMARQQLKDVAPFMERPLAEAREQLQTGLDEHGNTLTPEQRQQIERFAQGQANFLEGIDRIEFVLPSLTFERGLTLHTPTRPIHIRYFFKGHTRGDVVVYLPSEKILLAGDLLTTPILWSWSSYPADYVKTLRALEELDIERIVIGHGEVLTGKAYLTQSRRFLEAVVDHVRLSLAGGVSLERTQASAGDSETIQAFRRRFVEDTESGNGMFDQMVTWTVERAYLEATGELD
ncbi:MAG: MBL fold metallo-hydrolase [Gemmatimonadota bacterium]